MDSPATPRYRYREETPKNVSVPAGELVTRLPADLRGEGTDGGRLIDLPCAELLRGNIPRLPLGRLRELAPDFVKIPEGRNPSGQIVLPAGWIALHFRMVTQREEIPGDPPSENTGEEKNAEQKASPIPEKPGEPADPSTAERHPQESSSPAVSESKSSDLQDLDLASDSPLGKPDAETPAPAALSPDPESSEEKPASAGKRGFFSRFSLFRRGARKEMPSPDAGTSPDRQGKPKEEEDPKPDTAAVDTPAVPTPVVERNKDQEKQPLPAGEDGHQPSSTKAKGPEESPPEKHVASAILPEAASRQAAHDTFTESAATDSTEGPHDGKKSFFVGLPMFRKTDQEKHPSSPEAKPDPKSIPSLREEKPPEPDPVPPVVPDERQEKASEPLPSSETPSPRLIAVPPVPHVPQEQQEQPVLECLWKLNPQDEIAESHALQSLFMTDEKLTLEKVLSKAGELPGLQAYVLAHGSRVICSSKSSSGVDLQTLSGQATAMLSQIRESSEKMGLGAVPAVTLHADRGVVSFLHRGELCLLVLHGDRGFIPGVRERLQEMLSLLGEARPALPPPPDSSASES